MDVEHLKALRNQGLSYRAIAKAVDCGVNAVRLKLDEKYRQRCMEQKRNRWKNDAEYRAREREQYKKRNPPREVQETRDPKPPKKVLIERERLQNYHQNIHGDPPSWRSALANRSNAINNVAQ